MALQHKLNQSFYSHHFFIIFIENYLSCVYPLNHSTIIIFIFKHFSYFVNYCLIIMKYPFIIVCYIPPPGTLLQKSGIRTFQPHHPLFSISLILSFVPIIIFPTIITAITTANTARSVAHLISICTFWESPTIQNLSQILSRQ